MKITIPVEGFDDPDIEIQADRDSTTVIKIADEETRLNRYERRCLIAALLAAENLEDEA